MPLGIGVASWLRGDPADAQWLLAQAVQQRLRTPAR
jgi:hypothetical protein